MYACRVGARDVGMEHEVKRYKRYKRNIKLMLVGSGLWPDYSPHPKAFRMLLTVCSGFTSTAITFGIINFVYKNMTNINLLTKGLGLMISFLSLFLKVFILSMHEKDLRSLNKGLSVSFENDLVTPASRPHLLAHFPTFSRFFYTFDYSAVINIFMMIITPLMMVKHGKYLRMYPQIVPFSYEPGGIVHWSIFAFEILGGFYLWTITCGVDSVFGLYTLHVVGELRLLSTRLENLKASENYKKELKDCVDRHVLLMQSRPILERVFGFLSIWLAVTCAIVMCAIIFQVSQATNMTVFRVCYLLCYCFIKLVQAYSYAWFGNVITVEVSGTLHWCIYAFEVLTGYYCWSVTVGVDSVFGYYALHMVGELRLLAARFQELRTGDEHRSEFHECVDRHVLLLQSRRIMQRLFGFLSVWLAVTCAIVMCAIIFQATETKNMTAYRAIYLFCYCFLKLVQAYSYAWFGHIITLESDMCLDAIYNSHWPGSSDMRFMNDILVVSSQTPMDFKAMGCMIVKLDMFSKIIHASASYFFLLQTLEESTTSVAIQSS